MEPSEYNMIVEKLQGCETKEQILNTTKEHFPHVSDYTVGSIYSNIYTKKMKGDYPYHNDTERRKGYYQRFVMGLKSNPNVIVQMAKKNDMSPCMLLRFILDEHLQTVGVPSIALRELGFKDEYLTLNNRKKMITEILKDPYKIGDGMFADAIQLALVKDDHYGPHADSVKRFIGLMNEKKLEDWCKDMGLVYMTEAEMREKQSGGKTPDITLISPILVNGFIVNWLESKGSFGDPDNHFVYTKDQLGAYCERFGPGIVIYWYGYHKMVDCQRENGIAVLDRLPKKEDVTKLDLEEWATSLDLKLPPLPNWEHEDI